MLYASYALKHPDWLEIVGVADLDPDRRGRARRLFGFPEDRCFPSAEALAEQGKLADVIINGTMDHQHVATSLPLVRAGYDILLEKPFATNEDELWELVDTARQHDRKVMICHVLRYAPFYRSVKETLATGVIGDVLNIQTVEHVSYHHMAVGYVRGKWRSKKLAHASMLLAKCCHDLDLLMWLKAGIPPSNVASFGGNYQFTPEKRPPEAGTRCLVDCPIEPDCPYSARKHYIDHPDRWSFYVWASLEHIENPTIEQKIESLSTDNPFGKCVWRCDNDVVDHQSVALEFADGSTATHNMVGGSSRPMRAVHILGTRGEIQGTFSDSRYVVRGIDPRPGHEYSENVVDLRVTGDMDGAFGGHGGGDMRLVSDFLRFIRGQQCSISCTTIDDSVNGHLAVFYADRAMEEGRIIRFGDSGERARASAF